MYIEPDGRNVRVGRFRGEMKVGTDLAMPPEEVAALFRTTQDSLSAFWSSPLWAQELSGAILTLRQPVRRDGRLIGIVLAAVSISDLSRFLSKLYVDDGIRAVLLDEPDHVLAHPSLVGNRFQFRGATDGSPLPRIENIADPVLQALALDGRDQGETLRPGLAARIVETAGGNFIVLQRQIAGYGPQAWTLGVILPSSEYTQQLVRLWWTGVAGITIMLIAVAAALLISRGLSQRIARFADIRMPVGFYDDWVKAADDEAKHFNLLCDCLESLGSHYGSLPAHAGMWRAAEDTADDLPGRLAVVPMVLEARGLDVTPGLIEVFRTAGDTRALEALQVIYGEEVAHVAYGSKWFHFLCGRADQDPKEVFHTLVRRYFHGALKPPFNEEKRAEAGMPPDFYWPLAESDAAGA
jgi:uncharacterized ferritin-like protein (DUF455 family)